MEKEGIVVGILNGEVSVRTDRDSACGGECGSCHGCKDSATIVKVKSDGDFVKGDYVTVIMEDSDFLKMSAFGYLFPVGISVLGALGGYFLKMGEGIVVLGWFIGLGVGFLAQRLIFADKNIRIRLEKLDDMSDNK